MPRESLDRIREALARLPTASRAALSAEWVRLYRTDPPARLGRELLMAAIGDADEEARSDADLERGGARPRLPQPGPGRNGGGTCSRRPDYPVAAAEDAPSGA